MISCFKYSDIATSEKDGSYGKDLKDFRESDDELNREGTGIEVKVKNEK
jgi:hypothetical protein